MPPADSYAKITHEVPPSWLGISNPTGAFALVEDGKEYLLDQALLDELAHGVVPDNDERVPVLLAVSDNGPQMTSKATSVFMAGARIAQHFGRPGTPNDQAWVESFFGHLKGEFPHLDKITDPGDLEAELDRHEPGPVRRRPGRRRGSRRSGG